MEPHTGEIIFHSFSVEATISIVVLLILITISAAISGSVTAMSLLYEIDIDILKKRSSRRLNCIVDFTQELNGEFRSSFVVASALVNIAVAIAIVVLLNLTISFGGALWVEYLVKAITIFAVITLLGNLLPKRIASAHHVRFLQNCAPFIVGVVALFRHISPSVKSPSSVVIPTENSPKDPIVDKRRLLSGVMRFGATEVSAIMTHRMDVIALEMDDDFAQVKSVIKSSGFSRIPVYGEDMDDIKGVLYVKDLLMHIEKESFEWSDLLRRPLFIPANKKISDLLEEFQARHIHFSIVVDEYGSTLGIVSLEDIMEEIVGEISDESDSDEKLYKKIDDKRYLFDGKSHIADFLRLMSRDEELFDELSGDAETIAGLMLEVNRDFLKVGDELTICGFLFRVEQIEGRRISKIKVTIL